MAKKEQLQEAQKDLEKSVELFQQRLDWMNSESRRLFGVIEEQVFTIIIDIQTTKPREFDQFICALERLVNEQVRYSGKFNLIRFSLPLKFSGDLTTVG